MNLTAYILPLFLAAAALGNPCEEPRYLELGALPAKDLGPETLREFADLDSLCRVHQAGVVPGWAAPASKGSMADSAAAPVIAAPAPDSQGPAITAAGAPAAADTAIPDKGRGKSSFTQRRQGFGVLAAAGVAGTLIGMMLLNIADDECELEDIIQSQDNCEEEAEGQRSRANTTIGFSALALAAGIIGILANQDPGP